MDRRRKTNGISKEARCALEERIRRASGIVISEMLGEYSDSRFNTDEFARIPQFGKRVAYCRERLGRAVGDGSSRIVFAIDDGKVLKLAKNRKGVAQNEAECTNSEDSYIGGIFAKTFEYDPEGFTYIVAERARKARKDDFPKILGISYDEFLALCNRAEATRKGINKSPWQTYLTEKDWELAEENEDVNEWIDYVAQFNIFSVPEITALRNLGVVNRCGRPKIVITDSGFDEDSAKMYKFKL